MLLCDMCQEDQKKTWFEGGWTMPDTSPFVLVDNSVRAKREPLQLLFPHGSWVVQQYAYPMTHGLCNSMLTPWVMDCTVVELGWAPHGSWVVQQYIYPMAHGSCNGTYTPWVMDCTMVQLVWVPHRPWTVHQCIYPTAYGLSNITWWWKTLIHCNWTSEQNGHISFIVQQLRPNFKNT